MNSYYRILGVKVYVINLPQAQKNINTWIENRDKHYVCLAPAHAIMSVYNNSDLVNVYNNSGMTTPDGMVIVWILKMNGYRHVSRVYGPDLLRAMCSETEKTGLKHYFYGGEPHVVEELVRVLQSDYPELNIIGYESPPFRPLKDAEEIDLLDRMGTLKPDIFWVGLGSPKQEIWMSEHLNQLDVKVMIGVGAAFDFLSGNKKQAPKWMQKTGLEWFFRLITEPKRLWRRYILYPKFVFLVLLQQLTLRNFDQQEGD